MTVDARSTGIAVIVALLCSIIISLHFVWTPLLPGFAALLRAVGRTRIANSAGLAPKEAVCSSLPSHSNAFNVELCQSSSDCNNGYLAIHAEDLPRCGTMNVDVRPQDGAILSAVRTKMGPHDFYAIFRGAEKYAVRDIEYKGRCNYRLHFDLTVAGDFLLDLSLTHEAFEAINETMQDWPRYLNQSIVDGFALSTTSCSAKPVITQEQCPGQPMITKAWVSSLGQSASGYDYRTACLTSAEVTKSPAGSRLLSDHPSPQARKGLVLGDSQARSLWDTTSRRMRGGKERIERVKVESGSASNGTLTLDYRWDPFLEHFLTANCTDIASYDAVFFQIGQWPASFSTFWTTQSYLEKLEALVVQVKSLQAHCPPFEPVWLGINAFPLRNDDIIKQVLDHRTPQRLRLWDTLATNLFTRNGIKVADAFNITLPMIDTSEDLAHFLNTDAEEALVDNLFEVWGT